MAEHEKEDTEGNLHQCFCCIFTERHSNRSQTHGKIIDFVSAKQREISQKVAKKQKYVFYLHDNLESI